MKRIEDTPGTASVPEKPDFPLLDSIHSAADVRRLSEEDLPFLAEEIRQEIIRVVSKTCS